MAFNFIFNRDNNSTVACVSISWVKRMEEFNKIAVLNSMNATIVALIGIAAIVVIFALYFKFLNNLKKDIKEEIDKLISKKIKEGAEIDRKKLNDEIIKKFMK